jgi:hypothetical protein
MVHALREAHRVLKPGGLLIDLRPAAQHRKVGLGDGRRWQPVGVMRESLDDDHAANRAVAEVLGAGLFRRKSRFQRDVDRVIGSPRDFRVWLDEFAGLGRLPVPDRLLERLEAALKKSRVSKKIVIRGPLALGVLEKS